MFGFADAYGMGQELDKRIDIAKEPVDFTDDADFMDTGVLHEERICTECGNDLAAQGMRVCTECAEALSKEK